MLTDVKEFASIIDVKMDDEEFKVVYALANKLGQIPAVIKILYLLWRNLKQDVFEARIEFIEKS
ncbi:MAG TPA: hypothetical protein VMO76_14830 [Candidatus Udaeobacter sp.]|nr:hypothetical protein [Candidatus Udaeobacter sp.]